MPDNSPRIPPDHAAEIAAVLSGEKRYAILTADVIEALRLLPDGCIPCAYFDPPYGLGAREPSPAELLAWLSSGAQLDTQGDFMGKDWQIPPVAFWIELHRVLMSGAIACFFGGTQTDDLLSMGARMAGLSRMDAVAALGMDRWAWVQAQGMSKHGNLGKQLDTAAGAEREVVGRYMPPADSSSSKTVADHLRAGYVENELDEEAGRSITVAATAAGAAWEGWHGGLAPKYEPLILVQKTFAKVTSAELHLATGWEHWHIVRKLRKPQQRTQAAARFAVELPPGGEVEVVVRKALHPGAVSSTVLRWRPVARWRVLRPDGTSSTEIWRGPWQVLVETTRAPYRSWTTTTLTANLLVHGVGALNIDGTRVFTDWSERSEAWKRSGHSAQPEAAKIAAPPGTGITCHAGGRFAPNVVLFHHERCRPTGARRVRCPSPPADTGSATTREGVEHAFAQRSLISHGDTELAPLSRCLAACTDPDCAGELLHLGGGAPPACSACGGPTRWCCAAAALDEQSGTLASGASAAGVRAGMGYHGASGDGGPAIQPSAGGASRFYPQIWPGAEAEAAFAYAPKAPRQERDAGLGGARNPGVCRKPVRFGRRQVRQIAPEGSVVLIPYCGTGSEVIAALLEGHRVIGIERDPRDSQVARQQAEHVLAHGEDWVDAGAADEEEPEAVDEEGEELPTAAPPAPKPHAQLALF